MLDVGTADELAFCGSKGSVGTIDEAKVCVISVVYGVVNIEVSWDT